MVSFGREWGATLLTMARRMHTVLGRDLSEKFASKVYLNRVSDDELYSG